MENIIPQMEAIYSSFTPLEKTIADFLSIIMRKQICHQKVCQKSFLCQKPPCPDLQKNAVIKGIGSLFSVTNSTNRE